MFGKNAMRNLRESTAGNMAGFVTQYNYMLGLCHADGTISRDQNNHPRLNRHKDRLLPGSIQLRGLLEQCVGSNEDSVVERWLLESAARRLAEASPSNLPSGFESFSYWNTALTGLVEASVLEKFEYATNIGNLLMPDKPSKVRGGTIAARATFPGVVSEARAPGAPTKIITLGENTTKQPTTTEQAYQLDIPVETVMFDWTGTTSEAGGDMGEWLGYRQLQDKIDLLIGVTGNYVYNDVGYGTYGTSGLWVNHLANNPLVHYDAIKNSRKAFRKYSDPNSQYPIVYEANTIVTSTDNVDEVELMLAANVVSVSDPLNAATVRAQQSDNPYKGKYTVLSHPLVASRQIAILGRVADDAAGTWFALDNRKAFQWVYNTPITTVSLSPGASYSMTNRRLASSVWAGYRGVAHTKDPRATQENRPGAIS